jgi:hypothetical protein
MLNARKFLAPLVGGSVGAAMGWGMISLLKALLPKGIHVAGWAIALAALSGLAAIGLHELGHVAAGLACGFEFYFYVAGPLWVERGNGRLRMKWNRSAALWGGVAACAPVTTPTYLRAKMCAYAAGGPLFSVLGALAIWPAIEWARTAPNAAIAVAMFGFFNAGLAAVTLIPMRFSGFVSDGGRLVMLARGSEEAERWMAMALLAGISMVKRAREWPAELVVRLGDGSGPDGSSVCWMKLLWHTDRREMDAAGEWLERGLSKMTAASNLMQAAMYASAAAHYARVGRDGAIVRDYYERARRLQVRDEKELRTVKASVLVAEGQCEEALAELEIARDELRERPVSIAEAVREELAELEARCQRGAEVAIQG